VSKFRVVVLCGLLTMGLIEIGCGGGGTARQAFMPASGGQAANGGSSGSGSAGASAPSAGGSGTTGTSGTGSGSGSGSNVPPGATLKTYKSNMMAASNWLARHSTLPDGAILYTSNRIVPYYSNIAAMGMVKDPSKVAQVRAWMEWYIAHLNAHDVWGLGNTIYDYNVSGRTETPANDADSTDSYPATFLSLAWRFFQTGNADAQWYVKSVAAQLDGIGQSLVRTQQSDGLTWAKPNYQIKYLMDNCEAYRGLRDAAALFNALGDASKAAYYNTHADWMLQGIRGMWLGHGFAVYKDNGGNLAAPNWGTWYADAVSQLFPVLEQVLPASDPKVQEAYWRFNTQWQNWANLSFNTSDPFPWALVANAAAMMGDSARVNTYIVNIQNLYVNKGFPWPFYSMEAGFFIQVNAYMAGEGF
jgi:hypothetical protein